MSELKPCPFCGGEDIVLFELKASKDCWVECKKCWASSNVFKLDAKAEAIAAWNTRPSPWIPITPETMPEESDETEYIVRMLDGTACYGRWYNGNSYADASFFVPMYSRSIRYLKEGTVTHYMPKPLPEKGTEDDR